MFFLDSRGNGRRWDNAYSIKDLCQPAQRPLLVQPGGQYPLALSVCLDVERVALACFFPAVGLLEQLDLLVWVDIEALRRQTRQQRPRQRLVGDGGVRMQVQVCPVVLVLEVVQYLAGERLLIRKVGGALNSGWM